MSDTNWAQPSDHWSEPSLVLCCPVCWDDSQHHSDVTEFVRLTGEDGQTWRFTRDEEVMTDENPSPRRNAVRIEFECEAGHVWWLDMIQHKGQTFAFARFRAEDQPQDDEQPW